MQIRRNAISQRRNALSRNGLSKNKQRTPKAQLRPNAFSRMPNVLSRIGVSCAISQHHTNQHIPIPSPYFTPYTIIVHHAENNEDRNGIMLLPVQRSSQATQTFTLRSQQHSKRVSRCQDVTQIQNRFLSPTTIFVSHHRQQLYHLFLPAVIGNVHLDLSLTPAFRLWHPSREILPPGWDTLLHPRHYSSLSNAASDPCAACVLVCDSRCNPNRGTDKLCCSFCTCSCLVLSRSSKT